MQILGWLLLKGEHDEQLRQSNTIKSKDAILLKHLRENGRTKRKEGMKLNMKKLKLLAFNFICGKDNIPNTYNYKIGNINKRRIKHFVHSLDMKGEQLSYGVRNKVLPIIDASFSISNDQYCGIRKTKYQTKGNEKKGISRIEELHRWTTTNKRDESRECNEHKVLQLPRSGSIKSILDDEINFTLDMICREGKWITTKDFVVLEL
ncbi:PREDICTED: uncharacterized protein LOC109362225 isoform X2 [Lupinus angustifolius]|uniref:uncharacterized protein LOC109362225 isoform X2 n=1 Tax=Lupinus angustifolius TaxID=3871 RepID=UPI00092F4F0D|nr:PREDICTED: uncharacterized protein LOC109362225 isoform X2 [Lupinus angustifolius]